MYCILETNLNLKKLKGINSKSDTAEEKMGELKQQRTLPH